MTPREGVTAAWDGVRYPAAGSLPLPPPMRVCVPQPLLTDTPKRAINKRGGSDCLPRWDSGVRFCQEDQKRSEGNPGRAPATLPGADARRRGERGTRAGGFTRAHVQPQRYYFYKGFFCLLVSSFSFSFLLFLTTSCLPAIRSKNVFLPLYQISVN